MDIVESKNRCEMWIFQFFVVQFIFISNMINHICIKEFFTSKKKVINQRKYKIEIEKYMEMLRYIDNLFSHSNIRV